MKISDIELKRRISVLAIMSILILVVISGTLLAQSWGTTINEPASYRIIVDSNGDANDEMFAIWHDGLPGGTSTELFRIEEDGDVGIGTLSGSPNTLTIQKDKSGAVFGDGQLRIQGSSDTDKFLHLHLDTTNNKGRIEVGDSSDEAFAYYTLLLNPEGGNVGIGLADPSKKLEIRDASDSQLRLSYSSVRYTDFQTTSNGALMIDPSDSGVGIHLSNPAYQFHIHDPDQNSTHLIITTNETGTTYLDGLILGVGPDEETHLVNRENTNLSFWTNNKQRMTISNGGNVGIGVTSPTAMLHVDQSALGGSKPVLTLDQADITEELIKVIGSASNVSANRTLVANSDYGTSGSLTGWIKVTIQDDGNRITDGVYYIPFYQIPSA